MDLTVVAKIREFFTKINKASDPQNDFINPWFLLICENIREFIAKHSVFLPKINKPNEMKS